MRSGNSRWLWLVAMVLASIGCGGADGEAREADSGDTERKEQALLGALWANHGSFASRWVERAFQAVDRQNVATLPATRIYALVNVALYDAVNGIDRARLLGREQALVSPAGAPLLGLRAAAAVSAAHAVLLAQLPAEAAALDAARAADVAELGGSEDWFVRLGLDWGTRVAQQVIALRSMDGTQAAVNLPASTEIGMHRRTFDARYAAMAPFAIASKAPYAAPPPPSLTSDLYTASFLDAKANGTPDGNPLHEAIATFWGGDEAGAWQLAALALARDRGLEASLSATVRLYALVGMAVADSASVSHTAKQQYYTWRVVPAIHEAANDGNPSTTPDPAWVPRNGTGNLGSPEYTSGASAFAGGASAAIEHFFCRKTVAFCFHTETSEAVRCFQTPELAAHETGRARVLQGVHFQHSSDAGIAQGRAVGAEVGRKLRFITPGGRVLAGCTP